MKNRLLLILITVLFTGLTASAQKQAYNWYFANNCALNFSTGSPVFVNGCQIGSSSGLAQEGTASISDSAGNLLFYTSGVQVWNRNNVVMPHGDSLLGGVSATQATLIVPLPGSNTIFYVFTLDEFQSVKYGFRYSVVDMCLDNGLGDVIPCKKNILLLDTVTEKICAQRDSLGNYWILVHKLYSDDFYAYYLTSAGIKDTVISPIGTFDGILSYGDNVGSAIGQMKFSPNGKQIALAIGNQVPNILDLFDFNVKTGVVSNWIRINMIPDNTGTAYGVEFSPDNSKVYVTNFGALTLFQYNLLAGDSNAIIASRTVIDSLTTAKAALELATDGKIYVSLNDTMLGVINSPDLLGTACNYVDDGVSLKGNVNPYGFPSFVAGFNYGNGVPSCSALEIKNQINNSVCNTSTGSATVNITNGDPPYTITWNTLPPQTDSTATGLLPGTYIATITNLLDSCISTTVYDTIQIAASGGSIAVNSPTICNGDSVVLTTSNNALTYTWSPGTALNTTIGDSVITNPTITTTYTVIGTGVGGCADTAQTVVTVNPSPLVTIVPPNPSVCSGQSILLIAGGATTYLWSPLQSLNSSTGDTVVATPSIQTTYTVVGTNSNGCSASDTDVVSIILGLNTPVITQHGDTLFSSATQGNQWVLNDTVIPGATNEFYIIKVPGWYKVLALNPSNGCSTASDSSYYTPTGINQLSINSNQLSIYPNPTGGEIFINISSSVGEVKDWYLQITDVLGRTVYTRASLNYNNEIDLSDFSSGVYFITVINKTGRAVVPVVKQ